MMKADFMSSIVFSGYEDAILTPVQRYLVLTLLFTLFAGIIFLCCSGCYYLMNSNDETFQNKQIGESESGLPEKSKRERATDTSSVASEAVSLLDEGEQKQLRSDKALMDTFVSVISQGILIKLHTTKGPKDIKFLLQGNELRWHSMSPRSLMNGKRYKLQLSDVERVEWGKKTSNFMRATAFSTPEDLCFSLLTQKTSLDLEASSKVERDSLAQGFSILISTLNSGSGAV